MKPATLAPAPYTVTETVESQAAVYRDSCTVGTPWSEAMLACLSATPTPSPKLRRTRKYCSICGEPDCTIHVVVELIDV